MSGAFSLKYIILVLLFSKQTKTQERKSYHKKKRKPHTPHELMKEKEKSISGLLPVSALVNVNSLTNP
jgi:hypothetical protein